MMVQCSTCGTPVCALDSTTGPQIEALKSHIAAIDEKLSESHKLYRNDTKQDGAMRWALFALGFFVTLAAPALSNDLIGNASIIDGDTLEIHGSRIRLWGIDAPESTQLCRGSDSLQYRCGARAANDLDAFIAKRPVNCIRSRWTSTGGQWRHVRSTVSISGNGWCAAALRSTGRSIQSASTTQPSAMPSMPGAVCGRAAMSSRGYIVRALGKAAGPPTVRMMLVARVTRTEGTVSSA
jgi:hypothetical protein